MALQNQPDYMALGSALRAIRLRKKESLLEVSSAIEISGERLARIENGELAPTEDILELLVTHYVVSEHEEEKLWQLAGFPKNGPTEPADQNTTQNFFVMPFEARVMYADSVQVVVNDHGVIVNFMQPTGNGQQLAVARVGMSEQHAKSMLQVLQRTLEQTAPPAADPKRLNAPKDTKE